MNGPEHYREAEALITAADPRRKDVALVLAAAQAHATLALAAATMDAATLASCSWTDHDHLEWTGADMPEVWRGVLDA